ncbi:cysteine desulfurase family protein [Bacillus sp. FJAT-44742]|uniref:cysteine desulfurase family protein n=1 Tax=Bacillus sp. FJAT-44742 TaxID=2014005 RepID=UPI000C251277|nr:cysteine desulfurase family protein [Bacillus sp. FJAT-44742]
MIYLDNSATTSPYPEAVNTFTQVSQQFFGNPSSLHSVGLDTEMLLTKARSSIARLLHITPSELIFTSGGTEGNNLAIKGAALEHQGRGRHVITTEVEHPSVKEAFSHLEKIGFEVTWLPVNKDGRLEVETLVESLREDTILVSVIHVNNEMGTIQPIEEIGTVLKDWPKAVFHVDHVQGMTKVPLSFKEAHIDLCTFSAHKFHGLKGTGAIYIRSGVKLSPLFHGGSQELAHRPGTENVAGIAAMAKALRLSLEKKEKERDKMERLKEKLMNALDRVEGVYVNTPRKGSAPHIVNFSIPGVKPEVLIQALTKKDIHVSTRSACSSRLHEPSEVLLAAGKSRARAESAIRVSFSLETTEAEIEALLGELHFQIPELLKVMGANKK